MVTTFHHTKSDLEKLANSIIYLCNRVADPTKTKILKLVYFLQEKSIHAHGIPFFKMPFKVWQYGPVNPDLYNELTGQPFLLEDYIEVNYNDQNAYIKPLKQFSDDEFSDREIELLEKITDAFKDKTAKQLSELTHYEGLPWHKTATENNLLQSFIDRRISTTNIDIDFTSLIKDDETKTSRYHSYLEYIDASASLKS